MKNEIKVGQVWDDKGGNRREVIFKDGNQALTKRIDDHVQEPLYVYKCTATRIFHKLISDPAQPWLPLPDDYRLVTDEERELYPKPKKYRFHYDNASLWQINTNDNGESEWVIDAKYAVHKDHVFKPAKPEYKTFGIDWSENYPTIGCGNLCDIGSIFDNYRIFGYCDNRDFKLANDGIRRIYDVQPCDHQSDSKYAVGRLIV